MNKLILSVSLALTSLLYSTGLNAQTITSFPYTQDFESWSTCGTSCATTCTLQDFWTNAASANRDFLVDGNGTSSSLTGPSVDHTVGNSAGKYLYAESSSPCNSGTNDWHLVSPPIVLTGSNDIQFTFWYHMFGQSMGDAHVDVTTDGGTTWTLDVIPSWTDDQDQWQQAVVSLGAFTGTAQVRIRYENPTNFYGDFAVDDFLIFDLLSNDAGVTAIVNPAIPTCTFNDTVTVTLTNFGTDTLTSVSLNWSWNATLQTPAVFWTGSLASGESIDVFVGTAMYGAGDDLSAWTSNPNGIIESPSGAGNDTTSLLGLLTGLSGVYTIGGTTPDFTDIPSAIAALDFAGVCGPTTFDIRTGTYFDQIELGQVTGMSATNTVTFKSETGDRDDVIIDFAATSSTANYVVKLDNADYYRMESMTIRNSGSSYGRVFDISGGSDYNIVYDCDIHTQYNTSTTTNACVIYGASGSNDNFNRFEGNSIIGGSYGAYIYGTSTTSLQQGNQFINNEFVDNYYMGLRLYYTNGAIVTGNRVHGNSTYSSRYGIYSYYGDGPSVFTHNTVEANATSSFYYGMYFSQCDGDNNGRGLIANNSVTTGNVGSSSTSYALYFITSGNFDIYNNSFSVIDGGTSSRALYISNGGANVLKNNSFTNFGSGYAAYVNGTFAITEMDYNNLLSNGANIGYFGSNITTFANWQTTTGYDANSLNVDPGFYSDYDLHVCSDSLNGQGTPLALVTDDRDYHVRNASTPDIGSDEFAPTSIPGFVGPDMLICTGDSVSLIAGAPSDQVSWSTGDTTGQLLVTVPGTYTVSVIGSCGIAFDTVVVTASALTYSNFIDADTMQFCAGGSVLLTSTMPATSYSWTGGSSNDSLVVTAGGTYTLNITDACGTGSESVVITENTVPVAGYSNLISFVTVVFTNTSTGGGNPTYSWNFGDGSPASTSMSPSYVYSAPGTYWVALTVTNECGTTTYGDSITVTTVGLEEILANADVTLYPNPSNGEFTIGMELLTNTTVNVRIENIIGAVVYENNLGSIKGQHNEVVALQNAEAGVYFVRITAGDKEIMKKIVIE